MDDEEDIAILDFSQQRELANRDGWLQGRYYGEEGRSVRDILSFDSVFEVCRFEVGVNRRAERRAFRERYGKIIPLLGLEELQKRVFNTLSNGEMRRVLFARVLLKGARKLVLNDPMAGLDPVRRADFRRIISVLAAEGVEVRVRSRYRDELDKGSGGKAYTHLAEGRSHKGMVLMKSSPSVPSSGTYDSGNIAESVVELSHITVKFGKRVLFSDFSWKVRRGEHWVLSGPNGSGKTLLMAMICGDSPLAYANDVRVFGIPREPGHELSKIRRRIAMVSPEMQTYLEKGPEELLEGALARGPELLVLDEPCLNLGAKDANRLLKRVAVYLREHPSTTAIAIAHREDHVPLGFRYRVNLAVT